MLYAILAYHDEKLVMAMTPEEDARLMNGLMQAHERIDERSVLGPAARLDYAGTAVTLRDSADNAVIDGPFAETKEQLLGFYLVDVDSRADAIEAARELRRVNKTAVYEIRPVRKFVPGKPLEP